MSDTLGFKVIVEYYCENMIDEESLKLDFNNSPTECYNFISNNQNGVQDHPLNFTDDWKVINVEMLKI